jgi:hypothetical protein
MADPTRNLDTGGDTSAEPGRASKPGMPRWVKVGIIALVLVVLFVVILAVTGGHSGGPGPGGH